MIHKQNGGLSDARNAGMKYVFDVADSEDYITFVDSDDYIHPEYARIMINYCEENYKNMIKRKGMLLKKRLMYTGFYIFPYSAVVMGKIFSPRK